MPGLFVFLRWRQGVSSPPAPLGAQRNPRTATPCAATPCAARSAPLLSRQQPAAQRPTSLWHRRDSDNTHRSAGSSFVADQELPCSPACCRSTRARSPPCGARPKGPVALMPLGDRRIEAGPQRPFVMASASPGPPPQRMLQAAARRGSASPEPLQRPATLCATESELSWTTLLDSGQHPTSPRPLKDVQRHRRHRRQF